MACPNFSCNFYLLLQTESIFLVDDVKHVVAMPLKKKV